MEEWNEDTLIKGCIAWDRAAQNRLYCMFCSKMLAVCFRYSKNKEEAEDTLQEGFLKVFENIKSFKREGSLEGWIRRIMVNTAIQKFRKNASMISVESIENVSSSLNQHSFEDTMSQLSAKELIALIQTLPPKCQMVFNLFVFEGLKHKEIGERLGITEGTSKSNLSDARTILQRLVTSSRRIATQKAVEE